MGRFLLFLGRIAVWSFCIGIGVITYYYINKKHPPKKEFVPFPCPYCGERISISDDKGNGRYECFECGRLIVLSKKVNKEEKAQMDKERQDISDVAESLEISNICQRIVDRVDGYPNLFHVRVSVSYGEGPDLPTASIDVSTRLVDPYDLSKEKRETKELPPEPVEFYIKTKAGRIVFYRALVKYIQENYSYKYRVSIGSSRECVMFTVNS